MAEKRRHINPLKSLRRVGTLVDAYYEDLMKSHENGKQVAWYVGYPLVQLLQAQDVNYLVTEQYGARHAARHEEGPLLQTADAYGISQELCSYMRCSLACALYKLNKVTPPPGAPRTATHMEAPDFVLCTAPVCNQEPEWYDVVRDWYGVPGYMVECPHIWRQTDVEYAVNYLTEDLKDMVKFLEKVTKKPFNWEKLHTIMVETKKASAIRADLLQLARHVPAPIGFFDYAIAIALSYFLVGKPEATDVLEAMRDEAQERVKKGEGFILGEEKYRLFFAAMACWPKIGWLADKYASYGAAVVAGDYTHLTWYEDPTIIIPEKPLESLARIVATMELNQSLEWKIENYSKVAKDFSSDGLVFHGVRTCRPWSGQHLEIMDGMVRKLGIPSIYVDGDNANPQFVSEAQFETRMQALIETIDAQRASGKGRQLPGGAQVKA